jgi:hypothetical protein
MTERIVALVRRSIERGHAVEIEGLGTFRPARGGGYEFVPQTQPQVFVAYVAEDLAWARRLRDGIRAAGCAAWLDKDKLLPGQNWPRAIERAIAISDAFVACFSPRSIAKARTVSERVTVRARLRAAFAAGCNVRGAGALRAVHRATPRGRSGALRGYVSGLGSRAAAGSESHPAHWPDLACPHADAWRFRAGERPH